MKKNVNYVDAARFQAILTELGVQILPQKGFVKCMGAKGRNVYVPLTKTVGRVDVSGFSVDLPGLVAVEGEGSIMQRIDFTLPEAEILEVFRATVEHMLTLPAREIVRKARAEREGTALGWSFASSEETSQPEDATQGEPA